MGEWLGKNRFPISQVIKYTWNRTIMRKKKQQAVGDPRGRQGRTPLSVQIFFISVSAKIVQYNRLAQPPLDLAPPLGNPGSATYMPNLIWTHTHIHTHTQSQSHNHRISLHWSALLQTVTFAQALQTSFIILWRVIWMYPETTKCTVEKWIAQKSLVGLA